MVEELGGTGEFPDGKIDPTDEGELKIALSHAEGRVLVHFGKPVAWIGLDKSTAIALATGLLKHAGAELVEIKWS
jgi:hypothetical protein